jgi:hypothetical protein
VPSLEASPHRAQIEGLDKQRALVHAEQDFSRDFLLPENVAVGLFNAGIEKIFGDVLWRPCLDLLARM